MRAPEPRADRKRSQVGSQTLRELPEWLAQFTEAKTSGRLGKLRRIVLTELVEFYKTVAIVLPAEYLTEFSSAGIELEIIARKPGSRKSIFCSSCAELDLFIQNISSGVLGRLEK